jgi:hypothetical protein
MFGKYLALGAAAAMVSAVPALAQKDGGSAKANDPNQVVCEKIEVLGSRVATKRVCMTRAEWAERKRLQRMELDRAQVNRGSCDGCQ